MTLSRVIISACGACAAAARRKIARGGLKFGDRENRKAIFHDNLEFDPRRCNFCAEFAPRTQIRYKNCTVKGHFWEVWLYDRRFIRRSHRRSRVSRVNFFKKFKIYSLTIYSCSSSCCRRLYIGDARKPLSQGFSCRSSRM